MTVKDLANYVIGTVPRISYPAALKIASRAWKDIRENGHWSFLVRSGQIAFPGAVSAGTVSVTQFSTTIDFDATSVTALNASATATGVPIIGRGFRAVTQVGNYFVITAYDSGTGVATLDRMFSAVTTPAATYVVNRPYFTPPGGEDFIRFYSVVDPTEGYPVEPDFLRVELDRMDPQRQATGNPYRIAYFSLDPVTKALPLFEAWPTPDTARLLETQYTSKGLVDWSTSQRALTDQNFTFPPQLNTEVLEHRALWLAYQWAEANKGRYEELRGITWRFMWQEAQRDYNLAVTKAQRVDRELALLTLVNPAQPRSPLDAKFWQSHDVVGWA
jgi:hypothetical protein